MTVLLLLIVAVPLACLAFLSLLSFVGVLALGGTCLARPRRVGGTDGCEVSVCRLLIPESY